MGGEDSKQLLDSQLLGSSQSPAAGEPQNPNTAETEEQPSPSPTILARCACMGPSCKMTTAAVDEMRTSLMTSARSRSSPSPSPCSQGEPRVAQLDAPHAAEPRVARSLLHVPVLLTCGHRKENTLALADTGARMDVISREMATRLVPKRLWTSLRTPMTAQGALAGTTTSIDHCVTVTVTLGEKGTQFSEERAFFVMDTDLPLILGKVWFEDREAHGLQANWSANTLAFAHPGRSGHRELVVVTERDPHRPLDNRLATTNAISEASHSLFGDNWMFSPLEFDKLNALAKKTGNEGTVYRRPLLRKPGTTRRGGRQQPEGLRALRTPRLRRALPGLERP